MHCTNRVNIVILIWSVMHTAPIFRNTKNVSAANGFLVGLQIVTQGFAIKLGRDCGGQSVGLQERDDVGGHGGVSIPSPDGEFGDGPHANSHSKPMDELIPRGRFHRMAYGVAEIEKSAAGPLPRSSRSTTEAFISQHRRIMGATTAGSRARISCRFCPEPGKEIGVTSCRI